jgi:hypothetical protein
MTVEQRYIRVFTDLSDGAVSRFLEGQLSEGPRTAAELCQASMNRFKFNTYNEVGNEHLNPELDAGYDLYEIVDGKISLDTKVQMGAQE